MYINYDYSKFVRNKNEQINLKNVFIVVIFNTYITFINPYYIKENVSNNNIIVI